MTSIWYSDPILLHNWFCNLYPYPVLSNWTVTSISEQHSYSCIPKKKTKFPMVILVCSLWYTNMHSISFLRICWHVCDTTQEDVTKEYIHDRNIMSNMLTTKHGFTLEVSVVSRYLLFFSSTFNQLSNKGSYKNKLLMFYFS